MESDDPDPLNEMGVESGRVIIVRIDCTEISVW